MLGIFQTKKAEYNELILRALVFGPKTTNQIAEYIYLNRKRKPKIRLEPQRAKEPNKNEVKKIVSIISRKVSRLEELKTKQYIYRKENLWHLTVKGTGVGLTLFNSIAEIFPYIKPFLQSISEDFRKLINTNPMLQFLTKGKRERKAVENSLSFFESTEFLQLLKDFTNKLVRQGTDLDKTNLKDFLGMVTGEFFVLYLPKIVMVNAFKGRGVK